MSDLCRAIGARQASFGIWMNDEHGIDGVYPWTLKESHGEVHLSREYARRGVFIEHVPDDATPEQLHDALAKHEEVRTVAEQHAWLRATYPDEFDSEGKWIP